MWTDFSTYDGFVVLLYLGVILAIGIYFTIKPGSGVDDYFFAGRRMRWTAVGLSLFSAQFAAGLAIPLRGSLASGAVTVMGCVSVTIAVLFILRLLAHRVFASGVWPGISDHLDRMFAGPRRGPSAAIHTGLLLVVRLVAVLLFYTYATDRLLDWGPGKELILIVLFVGYYSIVGGFQAVIVTQAFQAVPIAAGIVMLSVFGTDGVQPPHAGMEPLSWLSAAGLALVMAWTWSGDHFIIQHLLGAGSSGSVKKGVIAAVVINAFCLAAVIVVGMPNPGVLAELPVLSLPVVWKGIAASGILAVTMAQLAGIFSSGAAVFTMMVYQPRRPQASSRTLVLVGRLATTSIVIAAIIAVMTVRLIGHEGVGLLQTAAGMIVAPLAALVCVSFFRPAETHSGAGWVVGAGVCIGGIRVLLEALEVNGIVVNEWTSGIVAVDFLSLTIVLFAVTLALLAGIGHKYFTLRTP